MNILEFLTISKILLLIAWVSFVIVYYKSYARHKTEIYTGLKGEDGEWQPMELAAWYWFKFFPKLFFITLLIVIVGLPLNDTMEGVLITVWTATNGIFVAAIAGKSWGKSEDKPKEDAK